MRRTIVLLTIAALVAGGCTSSADGSSLTSFDPGTIDWEPCDEDGYAPDAECGTLTVPLDHDEPDGETIDLALVRLAAESEAVGSVLFNPGGPGGSGIEMVAEGLDPTEYGDLHATYDFIGFDPRGVGASSPIDCVDDAWLDAHVYADPTPDDDAEQAIVDETDAQFAAGCAQNTPGLAQYDTINTARDMDLIREAVGDEQLTFYGASYGTLLGATYATLFPARVRAMVLDGAFDPLDEDSFATAKIQIDGFEQAFGNWIADCESDESCAVHADDVSARWLALRAALDATPALAADGRSAGEGVLVSATITALYSEQTWPALANALVRAEQGDGTGLFLLADLLNGRSQDGTWTNISEANPVLTCTSGLLLPAEGDLTAEVEQLRADAPHFGYSATVEDFADPCAGLPQGELPALAYSGTGPILVTGGENDPATPIIYAERLVTAMGPHAGMIRFTGEGHTALSASSCVQQAAEAVLLDAVDPDPETTCDPDAPRESPAWFEDLPAVEGLEVVDLGDVSALLTLPDELFGKILATQTSAAAAADAVAAAFGAAGWSVDGPAEVELPGGNALNLTLTRGAQAVSVIVIDKELLASGDLASLGALVPGGSSVAIYTGFGG